MARPTCRANSRSPSPCRRQNDVDVFAHDLGYIAIVEKGKVVGYNVTVGGGMGMTHGETDTFPRTADVLGFCTPEQAVDVAETVVTVQRDWGNRSNRKRARLKYTIEDRGLDWFSGEVETPARLQTRHGTCLQFHWTGDKVGWEQGPDKKLAPYPLHRERAREGCSGARACNRRCGRSLSCTCGAFMLTPNQNLIIANLDGEGRRRSRPSLKQHGVTPFAASALRRNCHGLRRAADLRAGAGRERTLPADLITALEALPTKARLKDDDIVIRMTGCPNGCARPYLAEIGLVGRNPGLYNLYLGARVRRLAAQQALRRGCEQGADRAAVGADVRALR